MIDKFWKCNISLSANSDNLCREIEHIIFEQKPLRRPFHVKAYYMLKPFIPRPLQIFLQKFKANTARYTMYGHTELLYKKAVEDCLKKYTGPLYYIWFWPDNYKAAVCITHDVEEQEGFDNILKLADIDEKFGIKSSFEIVPERYKLDYGVFNELRRRGFEIAIQGLKHDGKLFSSEKLFKKRLLRIKKYAREWNAKGFRSPFLLRNAAWMKEMGFAWDSSFPHWEPFSPQPGGCHTVFPYFLSDDTVELPVTMMQDHALLKVLKKNDIILWKNKFNWILSLNGFVNIIVHPDYVFDGNFLKLYCELLEYVTSQKDVWIALPLQIAQWWKDRNNSSIELVGGEPFIRGPAKERGKAVVLSNQVWSNVSYR